MNFENSSQPTQASRREFLKQSGKVTVAASLASPLISSGQETGTRNIKIGLVGCGGRGTGAAANALQTSGPKQLWAMGDVFSHRLDGSRNTLAGKFDTEVAVPSERQFIGFDAYKKVIDAIGPGGLVILTTPPAFRPIHLEYAVSKGVNVFMEKSFAVDAPGIRRVLRAGEAANKKNLKIAGGLMSRHSIPLQQAVKFIHEGGIGDIITAWAYRMHGPVGLKPRKQGMTELAYQISNYSCFTWLNGSFIVDWLIHNIDVSCWVKNDWPVSVQGMGGRQVRQNPDQLFDHYEAEYSFPDGTRMLAQGRHMNQCWNFFGDVIHGTTGSAVLGEGITKPKIFKGHQQKSANLIWQYKGPPKDAYQEEHDRLFHAIRTDQPYNETERCAKSCMTAIMGRMACETGRLITWEEALASEHSLAPDLETIQSLDAHAPVSPDGNGTYPIAMPGAMLATV